MPKVYVVQDAQVYDKERDEYKSKYDLTPATLHGELVYLLPSGNINDPDEACGILRYKLEGYGPNDFILCTGSPELIGWATGIAAFQTDGLVNMLKWQPRERCYQIRRAQLW